MKPTSEKKKEGHKKGWDGKQIRLKTKPKTNNDAAASAGDKTASTVEA